jgi:hypothetical protein
VEAGHGSWALVVACLLLAAVTVEAGRTVGSTDPWVAAP